VCFAALAAALDRFGFGVNYGLHVCVCAWVYAGSAGIGVASAICLAMTKQGLRYLPRMRYRMRYPMRYCMSHRSMLHVCVCVCVCVCVVCVF